MGLYQFNAHKKTEDWAEAQRPSLAAHARRGIGIPSHFLRLLSTQRKELLGEGQQTLLPITSREGVEQGPSALRREEKASPWNRQRSIPAGGK